MLEARRGSWIVGVKLVIAAMLLWWTFRNIEATEFLVALRRIGPAFLIAAVALQWVAYLFGSLRWWLMLAHADKHVSFLGIQSPYYLGLFFNQFLPSSVGGDAVRIATLYRQGVTGKALVSSSLMDRIVGLIVLLWLGLVSLSLTQVIAFPSEVRRGIIACAFLVPLAAATLFLPLTSSIIRRVWPASRIPRARSLVVNVLEICRSYGNSPRLIFAIVILSLLLQLSATAVYLVLGRGLGIQIPFFAYVAIIAVVYITASLPISLGGLGIRENVFVSLMVLAGVARAEAAALAVLFLLMLWVSVLPGLYFFLRSRQSDPSLIPADGGSVDAVVERSSAGSTSGMLS